MENEILLERKPYAPIIFKRESELIYLLPVQSSFASLRFEMQITHSHFEALLNDEQRYYFLFAALHHPYQLEETRLSKAENKIYFDTILLSHECVVEDFLTKLDAKSNGSISNLVSIYSDHKIKNMRSGQWFR